jgi:hypothetical protein
LARVVGPRAVVRSADPVVVRIIRYVLAPIHVARVVSAGIGVVATTISATITAALARLAASVATTRRAYIVVARVS